METLPPVQTIIQTETQTQIVTRTVTTTYFNSTDAPSSSFTQDWAINQVNAYLCNLATSPPAIRYLAELNSEIWREANFYPTEVDQDYQGHKYSGWQVYFRNADERYLSRPYWSDLNWVVFKDGFVTELSNGALQVKADLIELNQ